MVLKRWFLLRWKWGIKNRKNSFRGCWLVADACGTRIHARLHSMSIAVRCSLTRTSFIRNFCLLFLNNSRFFLLPQNYASIIHQGLFFSLIILYISWHIFNISATMQDNLPDPGRVDVQDQNLQKCSFIGLLKDWKLITWLHFLHGC